MTALVAASALMGESSAATNEMVLQRFHIPQNMNDLPYMLSSTCGLIAALNMYNELSTIVAFDTLPNPLDIIVRYLTVNTIHIDDERANGTFFAQQDSIHYKPETGNATALKPNAVGRILSEGVWPSVWLELMAPTSHLRRLQDNDPSGTYVGTFIYGYIGDRSDADSYHVEAIKKKNGNWFRISDRYNFPEDGLNWVGEFEHIFSYIEEPERPDASCMIATDNIQVHKLTVNDFNNLDGMTLLTEASLAATRATSHDQVT